MRSVAIDNAAEVLAGESCVVAAWVFGSAQDGRVRQGGDIDIGVLFDRAPALDDLTRLRAALQDALDVDDIDLTPLNGASEILRFEAVSGRRIVCRDDQRCAAFVSLTAREYEDAMALAQHYL